MTFSPEWNTVYSNGEHQSRWPWSDLVSLVSRHRKRGARIRVLELGCGAGANVPFFIEMGADYTGLDGSDATIAALDGRFYSANPAPSFQVMDFTQRLPTSQYDLIVDRASLTCNSTADIRSCLAMVHDRLATDGLFIGVDWFSILHSEYHNGTDTDDDFTKTDFVDGPFQGLGRVHFSSRHHLDDLFQNFELVALELKTVDYAVDIAYSSHMPASATTWNIVARKKK